MYKITFMLGFVILGCTVFEINSASIGYGLLDNSSPLENDCVVQIISIYNTTFRVDCKPSKIINEAVLSIDGLSGGKIQPILINTNSYLKVLLESIKGVSQFDREIFKLIATMIDNQYKGIIASFVYNTVFFIDAVVKVLGRHGGDVSEIFAQMKDVACEASKGLPTYKDYKGKCVDKEHYIKQLSINGDFKNGTITIPNPENGNETSETQRLLSAIIGAKPDLTSTFIE